MKKKLIGSNKPIEWVVPNRKKLPKNRGLNNYADWKEIIGTITKGEITDDIPLTEKAIRHWQENKDDVTRRVNLSGLSEHDIASILSAAKRDEVSVGVNRWGKFSNYGIKNVK